jgi:cytochrome P450
MYMQTWTLYELTQNDHCMERVLEEANAVFVPEAESNGPEYASFKNLSYSANALKEALRKYAIVPVVTRQVPPSSTSYCITTNGTSHSSPFPNPNVGRGR